MNARGLRTTARDVTLDIAISLGSGAALPFQSGAEARREGARSHAAAAGAVPDGKVAGPALGHGAEDRPRGVGLQGLRRSGGTADADLRRAAGSAADRDH